MLIAWYQLLAVWSDLIQSSVARALPTNRKTRPGATRTGLEGKHYASEA